MMRLKMMRVVKPSILLLLASLPASTAKHHEDPKDCPCKLDEKPDVLEKAATARWMVHSLDWGVLSTISTRLDGGASPIPFGNIYSFVDGTCNNSTGVPYMYGTFADQSLIDSTENNMVSLTLSEASLSSVCANKDRLSACTLGTANGDPENPVCGRLTLTGSLIVLEEKSDEFADAKKALFQRHTSMKGWPDNHGWVISKIDIQDIWLIDYFGGATILSNDDYFGVDTVKDEDEN